MRKHLLAVAALVMVVSSGVFAQGVTTASVSGIVTDSKGEPIPGANVVATDMPTGTTYGTPTRADGRYTLPAVRVGGPYTVKVSFVGFKEQVRENVFVQLGQDLRLDFKLVEEATELGEVIVSATQDPTLNSDKMGASSNFGVNQIQRLPSIGRDFRDITRLTPQAGGSQFTFGGRSSLYNNLTIDGATTNNVFGLSALPGGQSNTTPFSLDAIEDMTVSLSPYDLRQGNFTGAGVSAVTRRGKNEVEGSVYYFFRNDALTGKKVDGTESPLTDFNFSNFGFRVGGPIIKNKLFFFANAEFEDRTDPAYTFPIRPNRSAPTTGFSQGTDDNDAELGFSGLNSFLNSELGYDPGVYKDFNLETSSKRYVVRFDYNLSPNHKLTVRGNITNAFRDIPPSNSANPLVGNPPGGRGNNNNVLSFSQSYYRQNQDQYSIATELNSTFGDGKFSNNLVVGYSAFRDFRQNAGGLETPSFPIVDILGPNGQNMTTFGPDPFTKNNKLDQDVIQINDFFSIYLKDHTVTIGTANELYTFQNVFTPLINGVYRYNSLADFYADANPATTATARPASYTSQFVAVEGGPEATAVKWSALQLGFFAQDEYTGIKNLKLTAGLRVDVPLYLTNLPKNNYLNAIDLNGEQLRTGAWPTVKPLWSPRVGFNWDVFGDRSFQVRGGTGVLTGRVPFVWLSNMVSNNGLFFGQFGTTTVPFDNIPGDLVPYNFSTTPYVAPSELYSDLNAGLPFIINNPLDRNFGRPAVVVNVNTLDKDFRFPQVWRSNLAIDKQLPGGVVGTLEFIYTKDINAVFIRDANLAPAQATLNGDGRPLFGSAPAVAATDRAILSNDRRINGDIGQALVLDNTKKGYQWSITGQLRKDFNRNFQISAAYTYTDAREVNPQSSSTAGTIFGGQSHVTSPNDQSLAFAQALTPHRVIAWGTYRLEYLKNFATTFGFTYEGRSGDSFSYIYGGDPNSDGTLANDLIYIPRVKEEIVLTTSNANDTRTVDQIWEQLDTYINQDKYLSGRRGQYAQRNATFSPWVNRLNLSVLQDFYMDVRGKRHTIQLSLNIDNFLNMLNSSWGLLRNPNRSQLINFLGYEQPHTAGTLASPVATSGPANTLGLPWAATTGKPVYQFNANADGSALTSSYAPSQTAFGRWQVQFGVRYIF